MYNLILIVEVRRASMKSDEIRASATNFNNNLVYVIHDVTIMDRFISKNGTTLIF